MNAILHRWENLLEAQCFPLLGLNTPVVLLLIIAIAREARAAQALQGAERGMAVGMLVGFSLPVFLEFLLLLAAWPRRRAQPQGQMQKS
jgi:hypothetical protein